MTPDQAAAVLGVHRDADEAEIDRAYRRLARELHPDRYIGASETEVRAASERFIGVTRARDVLLRSAAARTRLGAAPAGSGAAGAAAAAPRRGPAPPRDAATGGTAAWTPSPPGPIRLASGWRLFSAWVALLVVGVVFQASAGPIVSPLDLWLRLGLLVAFAIATGLTGRRWVWRATLVLIAVSAVATVVHTTVGGLLGLGLMIIASVGIAVQAKLVRFPDQ